MLRLRHTDAFRYRLRLRTPLRLADEPIAEREGLLLRLESTGGAVGWGEAAPLPGFSADTLAEAETALRALLPCLSDRCVDLPFGLQGDLPPLPPSVRYALDVACWNVAAADAGVTPAECFVARPQREVAVNGLIVGETQDDAVASARAMAAAGYRAVKLKVARQPVAEDAATVRAVAEALGDGVALRLDANRRWSWTEAHAFADAVAGVPIAYIEEPLAHPDRLAEFAADTGLAVALDESILDLAPADAVFPGVRALVLKPALLGPLQRTFDFITAARAHGMPAVLSSTFESGVGVAALGEVAAATGLADVPAGFDPYRRLTGDVLRPRLPLDGGRLYLPRRYHVRMSQLTAL